MTEPLDYAALAAAAEVDWKAEYLRLHTAYRALHEAYRGVLAAIPKTGFQKSPEEVEVERQASLAKNRRLRARRAAKNQCARCKKRRAKGHTLCALCLQVERERSRAFRREGGATTRRSKLPADATIPEPLTNGQAEEFDRTIAERAAAMRYHPNTRATT